jgi:hypothetical protein
MVIWMKSRQLPVNSSCERGVMQNGAFFLGFGTDGANPWFGDYNDVCL